MTIRSNIRRACRSDEGFSLTELLVVSTLTVTILAVSYLALNSVSAMTDKVTAREHATSMATIAIERMSREMRQAQELTTAQGAGAFKYNEAQRACFYYDVNHDGRPERVTYYVSGGKLYRTQAAPTKALPTAADFGAESTPEVVISAFAPTWTPNVFTYYTEADPPTVVAAGNPGNVAAVDINLVTYARSGNATATSTNSTWVRVRAVRNTIY